MPSKVQGRKKTKDNNVKVEEKNILLKSGRSCTTRSNKVNAVQIKVGDGFAEEKIVKISDKKKYSNENEAVQPKEKIGENKLIESNNDELVKNAGKSKSAKKKVKETEIDSQNSDQAIKSSPAKPGSKKATVEPTTLEENKTSEDAIAVKEISTSKPGKRNAKNEIYNDKLLSENVEENEKGNRKPHIGRKRKVEEELDEKKSAIKPSTIKNAIVERNKNTENVISEKKISTSKRGKKNNQLTSEIVEEKEESKRKPRIGRKRNFEGESSVEIEENENDGFNFLKDEKILKVALRRNEAIDKLLMEQIKEEEERAKTAGGAKQPKAGKRGKPDDEETGNLEKPIKIPKKESKGQSKKDKMPDINLLDFSNDSTTSDGKSWNLKLSSWNINGVRAWLEKDGLKFLKHEAPDVMCFQETKCSEKQLPEAVNVTGYHSYWLAGDKDGYSGVGMLSKTRPLSVKYGIDIEEHDKEGRVITAEYDNFYLVTAYVPNAGRGLVRLEYRMKWDKDFCNYLKKLDEKKPVILCGDLNVAHEEIDLANPKTNKKNAGFTKEEREGFNTLLLEGFIDSYRYLYPDEKAAYTFWTYMMNARAKNVGWRLDYFVMSKRFVDHLCDNVIRKDVYGSDHCPITLFLSV